MTIKPDETSKTSKEEDKSQDTAEKSTDNPRPPDSGGEPPP